MARRKMPRARYIVVDWNLIQTMSTLKDVPEYFQCIVSPHILHEIATKDTQAEKERTFRKFIRWLRLNVNRLWFSHSLERLFLSQLRTGGRRLSLREIIDHRHTRQWRRALRAGVDGWNGVLEYLIDSPPINNRNEQISETVDFIKRVAVEWAQRPHHGPMPPPEGEWENRSQYAMKVAKYRYRAVCPMTWWPILVTNPHRLAIYRWSKLEAFYSTQYADGHTRKFENNFDDIHYALLATYTGHLGTDDKGLIEAVTTAFPGLRVIRIKDLSDLKAAA